MFPNQDPEPLTKLNLDKPAEQEVAMVPAAESLQFRTAEMPDSSRHLCSVCNTGFDGEYYHLAGLVTCPKCAQERLADRERKGGWGKFGRAALFGLGAAIGGSILYGLISWVTGLQFSLLAIVVGIMVGKAVLYGSRGIRGRRFQVLAVLLTYGSITSSMIPEMIGEIRKLGDQKAAAEKKDGAAAAPKQAAAEAKPSFAGLVVAVLFLIGFALILPFFGIASVSGVLNVIIIGIGLMQAWRLTKADDTAIAGPYQPDAAATASA